MTLHYRRTLRWYGQRTLRPSKVELSIEEHFGYAAGDPTPLLIAKLRLPDVFHLVASNVQNPPAIRPNRAHSIGSSSSGHNSAAPAGAMATSIRIRPDHQHEATRASGDLGALRVHGSQPEFRNPCLDPGFCFLTSPQVQVGKNLDLLKRKHFSSHFSTFSLVLGLI